MAAGLKAGIRRGVMAADRFTQIANGLFRDAWLSFKAKGVFGFISTHTVGWHVTVADLMRAGPDGRHAVRAAVAELQEHGYLVREQLRHGDGTLGEVVYAITDRPALQDVVLTDTAPVGAGEDGPGAGPGVGVRRGVMAADRFTQVANGLFRDPRLSFKAKGLFGLLSTHRDGWRMSVTDLTRRARDGEAAVKGGLTELEQHGFLLRERHRRTDGTLGGMTYVITDLPALQNPTSQPVSGFPPVDCPTSDNHGTKNTIVKKTTQQNTSPLRPCAADPDDEASTDQGTEGRAPVPVPRLAPADEMHPGIRLLLQIGSERPELLLTGKALTDQGRVATVMMDAGFSAEQLRHIVAGRPLPAPVRTSVGAIVAARLRAAQAYPPPTLTGHHHDPAHMHGERSARPVPVERSTAAGAARTVDEALAYRALVECAGCGVPATAPGEDLCPACLGWPPCRTCPGPTPRRATPTGDGRCTTCATVAVDGPEGSTP
ncbi:hypothetical protein [Streptomyces sp. NPDC093094]|uniref:hypothetical protein n=1 Tax=Streptomyces sp. NPDC093094 TaxID=3366026 RepID=UPI0038269308